MESAFASPTRATIYVLDGRDEPATTIRNILPDWAQRLGAKGVKIAELDIPGNPGSLLDVVEFIRTEHHARGAIAPGIRSFDGLPDLMFDYLNPPASALGTFDVIAKTSGKLNCRLLAPEAAGTTLDDILQSAGDTSSRTPHTALILGASALGDALAQHLLERDDDQSFTQVTLADTDVKALNRTVSNLREQAEKGRFAVRHIAHPADLTRLMAVLPERCLIVHTASAEPRMKPLIHPNGLVFPHGAIVWDPTALSDSPLIAEAAKEPASQALTLVDGCRFQLNWLATELAEILAAEPGPGELAVMVDSAERALRRRQASA